MRTSAHTPKEGRPPPPTRHQRGERRERGRQREGRAPPPASPHLSNVENPNTSFKHLGNIQPRAQRACAPPPPSRRRPRPHRIHAPHRPGPGGGGPRGRPARGRGLSLSLGARVAEGTAAEPPGQGRPATRNFTRSLALGGGPTGRSRTPAGNGGVVACCSRHAGAGRASRSLSSNGLSGEEPPSSRLTAFPRLLARYK